MIRAIVACDPAGVIGIGGAIPWRYPADFRHFKGRTMGGCVIMGRRTWESIPRNKDHKKLPGRILVVLSRNDWFMSGDDEVVAATSLPLAVLGAVGFDIWICGGGEVYAEAQRLDLIDEWDVTVVPRVPFVAVEEIEGAKVVRCAIDRYRTEASGFKLEDCDQPEGFADAGLVRRVLRRRGEPRGLENARAALL